MLFGDKKKARVVSWSFSERGGMRAGHFVWSVQKIDTGAHIRIEESEYYELPVRVREYDVSPDILDDISAIAHKYNMHRHTIFLKSPMQVLDAPNIDIRIKFDDGRDISYEHYNQILPEGCYKSEREIKECIESYCKNENSCFELADPHRGDILGTVSFTDGFLTLIISVHSDEPVIYNDEYSVYSGSGECLFTHERTEREYYEEYHFREGMDYEVLIDLNRCGTLSESRYSVEIMGERIDFTLRKRKADG